MITAIKIQARGVLTLPKKMRTRLNFKVGSIVNVQERDGGILVTPVRAHTEHEEVMEDMRRSLEDFKAGNYIEFSSTNEFHAKRAQKWGRKLKK